MKDEALELVSEIEDPAKKLNLLREYLQALCLHTLHAQEAFVNIAFVGGTALRFIHALPRFSEDLDFSLHRMKGYEPEKWLKKLKHDLTLAGFDTEVTWNDRSVVHNAWIKISGILNQVGLSGHPRQKLSIKLEIDTRPPEGAFVERSLVTRHRMLALQHYDLASLMAGKLHALLSRPYPKGRDWYDLIWYLGRLPSLEPNLLLLQNALDQTHGDGALNAQHWKAMLIARLGALPQQQLIDDVSPFLERPEEALFLRHEYIEEALG